MSNRFHNKFHRHNHHTLPTDREGNYPDSAYDPIASPEHPFQGEFYVNGSVTTLSSVSAARDFYAQHGTFHGNVSVEGDLQVQGSVVTLNTTVHSTSALAITNTGTGPALSVTQTGSQPIAHFIDSGGADIVFQDDGYIGVGTYYPNEKITVVGNISSNSTIYDGIGNSSKWNLAYSSVANTSGNWNLAYNSITGAKENWNSVYSSVVNLSGNWNLASSAIAASAENWNSAYSSIATASADWSSSASVAQEAITKTDNIISQFAPISANWNSVYSSMSLASADWNDAKNLVIQKNQSWNNAYTTTSLASSNWNSSYSTVARTSSLYLSAGVLTQNTLPRFNQNKQLTDSSVFDNGVTVSISRPLTLINSVTGTEAIFTSSISAVKVRGNGSDLVGVNDITKLPLAGGTLTGGLTGTDAILLGSARVANTLTVVGSTYPMVTFKDPVQSTNGWGIWIRPNSAYDKVFDIGPMDVSGAGLSMFTLTRPNSATRDRGIVQAYTDVTTTGSLCAGGGVRTTGPVQIINSTNSDSFVIQDQTSDASPFVVDSDGSVIVGYNTRIPSFGNARLQHCVVNDTTNFATRSGLWNFSSDSTDSGLFEFNKSGSATIGASATVAQNSKIGAINFNYFDATPTQPKLLRGAFIDALADGVSIANGVPGRLSFGTSSGAVGALATERMRIDRDGKVLINDGPLIVNSLSSYSDWTGITPILQLTNAGRVTASLNCFSSTLTDAGNLDFNRSLSNTEGSFVPHSLDETNIGLINFSISDAQGVLQRAASIQGEADMTPWGSSAALSGSTSGRLIFLTCLSGGSLAERMRITNQGQIKFGGTSLYNSYVSLQGTQPFLSGSAGNVLNALRIANSYSYTGNEISWIRTISDTSTLTGLLSTTTVKNVIGYHYLPKVASTNNPRVSAEYAYYSGNVGLGLGSLSAFGFYSEIGNDSSNPNRWSFYAAGTSPSYFGGNVGIGTKTPNADLTVVGDISATGSIKSSYFQGFQVNNESYPQIQLRDDESTKTNQWAIWTGIAPTYAKSFHIGPQDTSSSGSPLLTLTRSTSTTNTIGSVGIGVNDPIERLTVSGNISASGYYKGSVYQGWVLQLNGESYPQIQFRDSDATKTNQWGMWTSPNPTYAKSFIIGPQNTSGSGLGLLCLTRQTSTTNDLGNVGIGTANAAERLTVSGNISASGNIYSQDPKVVGQLNFYGKQDTGTYTRTGNVVTVTMSNHGMATGQRAFFTSSGVLNGLYTITNTGTNTFTVITATSGTVASTNVTRNYYIRSSYNIDTISDDDTGLYTIYFTNSIKDEFYSVVASGTQLPNSSLPSAVDNTVITPFDYTALSFRIQTTDPSTNSPIDNSILNVVVIR